MGPKSRESFVTLDESSIGTEKFQNGSVSSLTTLAIAARDGDRRALTRFVEESQADVWRYCAYLTDSQSADDVTQDTYMRAIGSLHRFRGEGDAKVWLLSIARRAAADHLRTRARRRRLVERLRNDAVDPGFDSADSSLELTHLVRSLDAERRDAFVLTQILGLGYEEAARVCGCPIGTIRSRVARARDELASTLYLAERATGS